MWLFPRQMTRLKYLPQTKINTTFYTRTRSYTQKNLPHKILDVQANATLVEVTTAFRQKALQLHPDTNTDLPTEVAEEKFKLLLKAYEQLKWEIDERDKNKSGGVRSSTAYSHMSNAEIRKRFKTVYDNDRGTQAFQAFLQNKEAVWERLNTAWEKQTEYERQIKLSMERQAKQRDVFSARDPHEVAMAGATFEERHSMMGPGYAENIGPKTWKEIISWSMTINDESTDFVSVTRISLRVEPSNGKYEYFEQEFWQVAGKPRSRTITDCMSMATRFFVEDRVRAAQHKCGVVQTDPDRHGRQRAAAVEIYGLKEVLKHELYLWWKYISSKHTDVAVDNNS